MPADVLRSVTASSAWRTNMALRSASVCRAMVVMPHPYSAFSSRTARIRRTAASPLLTTAIRLGNVTVDRSDTRSVYGYDRGQGPNRWWRCRPILTPKQVVSPVGYRDAEVDPLIAAFLRRAC